MITVISADKKTRTSNATGYAKNILAPAEDGTRVHVALEEVEAGKTRRVAASDRTQALYIL